MAMYTFKYESEREFDRTSSQIEMKLSDYEALDDLTYSYFNFLVSCGFHPDAIARAFTAEAEERGATDE